jgi:hypothetical protein
MIWNNTWPPLLLHCLRCSQSGMFKGATSFNQDVSTWDVSSASSLVSGLVWPWDSAAACCLRRRVLILREHCPWCWPSTVALLPTHAILLLSCSWGTSWRALTPNKQTNLRSITSLTPLFSFFSNSQYHDHYSRRDDLEQYGTTISPLWSQDYMFEGATSFNQDLSTWNVSSSYMFVSGYLKPWDSAASCRLRRRVLRFLPEHSCRCCSYPCCCQGIVAALLLTHTISSIIGMLMRNSMTSVNTKQTNKLTIRHKSHTVILFYFIISWSLLLPWWSGTIRHHYFFTLLFTELYVCWSYVFWPEPFNLGCLIRRIFCKWFGGIWFCCFLLFVESSCLDIAGAFLSLLFISLMLSGHGFHVVAHACNTIVAMLMRRNSMTSVP